MSAKKILTDEKLLSKKSRDAKPGEIEQVVDDLLDTAEEHRSGKVICVGLAANQIGYLVRIFVIKIGDWYEPVINPRTIKTKKSGRMIRGQEACLSRPGKPPIEKMRFQRITIEYQDDKGATIRKTFHNFEARIVQHEMAHFEGRLI